MPTRRLAAAFDAADPHRVGRFWADLLDRPLEEHGPDVRVPGVADGQLDLQFLRSSTGKRGPNRMHLHLTSAEPDDQQRTVDVALALGAHHLDVGQQPDEGHIVLADPEGNELCVIEAGNQYLAGCGFLGELACDGNREVGVFWSAALEWPLVWDADGETAVQSPSGGTKVAWGGPPVASQPVLRQHFLVTTDGDRTAEIERLTALGATPLRVDADGPAVLADPDGFAFSLRTG